MTYKIRTFANGTKANGQPNVVCSLTVPAHVGRLLGEHARFTCEVVEAGLQYRPIAPSPPPVVPSWLGGGDAPAARVTAQVQPTDRYDRDELIACLRNAAALSGGRLTQQSWERQRRGKRLGDDRAWPVTSAIAARFGGWNASLEAAGLPTNHGRPARWNRARCVRALQQLAGELRRTPTSADYPRYGRPDLPSYPTLQAYLGVDWVSIIRTAFGTSAQGAVA